MISNLSQLTTVHSSLLLLKPCPKELIEIFLRKQIKAMARESAPQHLAKQIVSHVHGTGAIEHEDLWADFQKMLHENAPVLLVFLYL